MLPRPRSNICIFLNTLHHMQNGFRYWMIIWKSRKPKFKLKNFEVFPYASTISISSSIEKLCTITFINFICYNYMNILTQQLSKLQSLIAILILHIFFLLLVSKYIGCISRKLHKHLLLCYCKKETIKRFDNAKILS